MDGSNCHCSSILVKHLIIMSYEFQNIIIVVSKLEKCFRLFFLFDNEIKGQMGQRIFYHSIPKKISLSKCEKSNQKNIEDDSI